LKRFVPVIEVKDYLANKCVCILLAIAALGAFVFFGCDTGPPQRQSPFYWGTNAVLYDAQDVDLIGSLGNPGKVGARVTFYWSDVEPTPGNWQFTVYDGLVKRAASGQIPILGILAYAMKRVASAAASMQGTPWALSFCPPDDVEDFATFAAKVVARYPAVLYWEIWNEPNTTNFWRPSPDPVRYVELLKRSYAAIKAANPMAVVVLGGLSPGSGSGQVNTMNAAPFLEAVYQNGGKNYFDAVGFHPYNGGVSPDLYLADYVNSVHNVMKQYEDGNKGVWVTEIGWFVGTEADVKGSRRRTFCDPIGMISRTGPFIIMGLVRLTR